jgi:hypothetical protein
MYPIRSINNFFERILNMHALTKHEVLAVSGGDEAVSDIPFPTDGDYTPPPYIHAYDPLPPVRRQPVSRNPLP